MSNLLKQLNKLDVSKLKMKNGKTVESELKRHCEILEDCIMYALSDVYDSYTPKVYRRSYDLYNSLYVDDEVKIDVSAKGAGLSIGIHFDDGAVHKSFSGEDAKTAVLLNEGYQTHGSFSHVPYLGFRKGEHYIERGIEAYKKKVSNPFSVRLTINDEIRTF